MKRYWKIISLSMLIVLILGVFYIQSGLAAKEDIEVEFEKVSGNEAEVENLVFYGDYEFSNVYQSLQITNQEAIDLNQISMLQSLKRMPTIPAYKKLVEDYKGFMRGKNYVPDSFYEDENVLAYAEAHHESERNSSFDIDVLNKKSGETTSIKLDFPEKGKYNWVDVSEVQVTNGKLKVFVRGFHSERRHEMIVYTIDINAQKLEKNEVLLSTTEKENYWSDIRIINAYNSLKQQRYIMFYIESQRMHSEYDESSIEMENNPEIINNEILVYDVETDKIKKLEFEDEMVGALGEAIVHNSTLFVPIQVENSYEISQFDIEKQTWGDKTSFELPAPKDGHAPGPYMKLMNGKFYMISAAKKGHILLISDATTGKVLYEGIIKVKKDGVNQGDYRLYIHEIEQVQ